MTHTFQSSPPPSPAGLDTGSRLLFRGCFLPLRGAREVLPAGAIF